MKSQCLGYTPPAVSASPAARARIVADLCERQRKRQAAHAASNVAANAKWKDEMTVLRHTTPTPLPLPLVLATPRLPFVAPPPEQMQQQEVQEQDPSSVHVEEAKTVEMPQVVAVGAMPIIINETQTAQKEQMEGEEEGEGVVRPVLIDVPQLLNPIVGEESEAAVEEQGVEEEKEEGGESIIVEDRTELKQVSQEVDEDAASPAMYEAVDTAGAAPVGQEDQGVARPVLFDVSQKQRKEDEEQMQMQVSEGGTPGAADGVGRPLLTTALGKLWRAVSRRALQDIEKVKKVPLSGGAGALGAITTIVSTSMKK